MNKAELEKEIAIAPSAIPLQATELKNAGISLDSIPEATPAHLAKNLKVCSQENAPTSSTKIDDLDNLQPVGINIKNQNQQEETSFTEQYSPIVRVEKKLESYDNQLSEISKMVPASEESLKHDLTDPNRVNTYLSAWAYVLMVLSMVATLITTTLVCLGVIEADKKTYLIAPAFLLFFGILYFTWIINTQCCVCHQKQFVKARNRKKHNSHYIFGLGYIFPTALHIIFKFSYRCMVCGSKISMRKKN